MIVNNDYKLVNEPTKVVSTIIGRYLSYDLQLAMAEPQVGVEIIALLQCMAAISTKNWFGFQIWFVSPVFLFLPECTLGHVGTCWEPLEGHLVRWFI